MDADCRRRRRLYGTDAIGGTINFITRSDDEGVELNADPATTRAAPTRVAASSA
ncbi:MAG TPA: hypothetical protein VGQ91_14910 [Ideonella sp.]|jgi:outer membrane cobalamin receptor|nr:hypothetical protein [Ideonella sp.]